MNWTYSFTAPAPGTYSIESRAVDDSLNLETPDAGVPYTTTPSSALSLFSAITPVTANSGDATAVEVGVKFTSTTPGYIIGIRFYKGSLNTGTHVGDLWSTSGILLASAIFSNETATGWQQVNFSTPVKITVGATYVTSYHTNTGNYSDTPSYFDTYSGQIDGSLSAVGDGLNGVYTYSADTAFPATISATGDSYGVDVVFDDTINQPQANNDRFFTPENTTLSIATSALLANDTDPNNYPLSITGVSSPSNGTVTFNSSTQTVTFVPNTGYVGPAGFTYSVTDGRGGTASGDVSVAVDYPITAQSLFNPGDMPGTLTVNDASAVELGVRFQATTDGTINGIRFYKGPQNTGTHVGDLWSASGVLLATATFTNETASGWQEVDFSKPVAITAGTTYVASYHTNTGDYSADGSYFAIAHTNVNGTLTAPSSSSSGGDGVYNYSSSPAFPTNTYNASNYWVDIVFNGNGIPQTPPVGNNDSGFITAPNTAMTLSAATLLANDSDPDGDTLTVTGVSNPTNGTAHYNSSTQTATFTPTSGYTGPANFTYSTSDGHGNGASAQVGLEVANSLWGNSNTPTSISENDPSAIELGIKFTASSAGTITGIRFYKGPQNTGTHEVDLWSSTGTLLASASASDETASGWQEADFASPVSIATNTTYIAAYHTNTGLYSADSNYFNTALSNGPLTAPNSGSSGGNGVYAYGSSSLFPNNSYNATNYWVDVAFKGQLVG